jgi:hypothetical protein
MRKMGGGGRDKEGMRGGEGEREREGGRREKRNVIDIKNTSHTSYRRESTSQQEWRTPMAT